MESVATINKLERAMMAMNRIMEIVAPYRHWSKRNLLGMDALVDSRLVLNINAIAPFKR
jgi:hypothetical protein